MTDIIREGETCAYLLELKEFKDYQEILKKQYEQEENGEALGLDEREELKRLRRENRELRMEKEILKKASAYFAKEMK